jgi:TetR/AcrR family transcriptional regulator, transcriptional repressor for nem operon
VSDTKGDRYGRPKRAAQTNRRGAILDSAERLVQARGFNGFSYADVAAELGITKAALHYHFAGKAELGYALISRYAARFSAALADISDSQISAFHRLGAYAELYLGVLKEQRMCLCGMLAAEYQTLPETIREAVVAFFEMNHDWLTHVLEDGQSEGTIRFGGQAKNAAQMIVGTLEGAMLVARPFADTAHFEDVAAQLLGEFDTRLREMYPQHGATPGPDRD